MPSIIGADLKVVGNLVCESDIDIQGTVKGDIEATTVTVDKDARVDGSIRARSLIVSGSVDGAMEASEISLTSTARVTGELFGKGRQHQRIGIGDHQLDPLRLTPWGLARVAHFSSPKVNILSA